MAMLYGLLELLFYAVREFQKLESSHFTFWLSLAGAGALLMQGIFFLSGRLVHRDWLPSRLLGSLAGIFFPLFFLLLLLLPASAYLKPAVATILGIWQVGFLADHDWNQESFRQEYWAVHALKKSDGTPLENFANHPPPEQGGNLIPASTPTAQATITDIDSRRVADHFQTHFSFLAKLLWTKERPLPDMLRQDMESFFRDHPGTPYDHDKTVQLAGEEMLSLLEGKIERIVLIARIVFIACLVVLWLPLCAAAMYDAWKKLEPITG
jgi:hypothetical protein